MDLSNLLSLTENPLISLSIQILLSASYLHLSYLNIKDFDMFYQLI